ncbi:MAG: hypothetical protein M1834_000034 [Cirrosporium novae-zelandiae]|nr:MAG: hypothetical protein M1834_000034 [Cirrosporium novae-zelandiae]
MDKPTIYSEAAKGTLNKRTLQGYLNSKLDINERAPGNNFTPLMAAVLNGHKTVVKLLLENKADVNALSNKDETALWLATSKTPKNRKMIVKLLLTHGPDLELTPSYGSGNTPLMQAITEFKDTDIISRLVDAGAKTDTKNRNNKTAQDLAMATGNDKVSKALLSREQRNMRRLYAIDSVISVILHMISMVNLFSARVMAAGKSADLQDCQTAEDFRKNINKYVEDTGLERFFPPDNPFLQTMAEKLTAFKDDERESLNKPENFKDLIKLSLYQPVFGSMQCAVDEGIDIERGTAQSQLVERITRICGLLVPDGEGIELRFINQEGENWSKLGVDEVREIMATVGFSGATPLGESLKNKILRPLVDDFLDNNKPLARPILICIITDGCPNMEPENNFQQTIRDCVVKLREKNYPDGAVKFMISQIGDDEQSKEFLIDLKNDDTIKDALVKIWALTKPRIIPDQLDRQFLQLRQNKEDQELWVNASPPPFQILVMVFNQSLCALFDRLSDKLGYVQLFKILTAPFTRTVTG